MRIIFSLSVLATCIALSGCGTTSSPASNSPLDHDHRRQTEFELSIEAALNEIAQHQADNAKPILDRLQQGAPGGYPFLQLRLALGKYFLEKDNAAQALASVFNPQVDQTLSSAKPQEQLAIREFRAKILAQQNLLLESANERMILADILSDKVAAEQNSQSLWLLVKNLPATQLTEAISNTHNTTLQSWLSLAQITNTNATLDKKGDLLRQWQTENPTHPGNALLENELASIQQAIEKQGENIAVLIPLQGKYANFGEAIRDGLLHAYFSSNHQPQIRFYNVDENANFLDIYKTAINDGAKVVIGPLFKHQVELLYQQTALPVKTIALNKLPKNTRPNNLFEYSLAPEDEINSLANVAKKRHQNIFILNQSDETSQKNSRSFASQWLLANGKIISTYTAGQVTEIASGIEQPLNIDKSKIRIDLINSAMGVTTESNPKARTDIDAIFIFANPDIAKESNQLFQHYIPASVKKYGSSSLYRGYTDAEHDNGLDKITITDIPLVINPDMLPPHKYRQSSLIRLFALGIDAYSINIKTAITNDSNSFEGASGHIDITSNMITRSTPLAIFNKGKLQPVKMDNHEDR